MKKAWIAVLFSLLFVCSAAAFAACSKGGSDGTTVNFATYESWDEGFSYLSIMDGFGRVSRSDEQAHGGSYSAKVQPLGSHTDPDTKPYFYYPMKIEGDNGYNYSDFTYLNEISFWMYNAQSSEVKFEFCIIASIADIEGADCKGVQDVTLAPGVWTEVVYKPDYDALQNMCDVENIAGIGFRFDNCKSVDISAAPVLYLDDIVLEFSAKPNIVIEASEPARGEIQSFDAASSLVYVSMDSGIDFAETWLPAGSEKLPQGVKGGVEFTITEADIGTWPRLKFDSRTPQSELEKADYFSLLLYFEVPDESIDTVEIRMVPDTGDVYTEYVRTNEWVELKIDTDIIINNWSTVIGIRSRGLFWVQNGSQGYCFNDIKAIRVADIKGVFNEVRIPDFEAATAGETVTLPAATLEVNGQTVTAQSWECSVEYSDKALYENKFGAISVENSSFTPQAGGTYYVTYTAVYGGNSYSAQAELYVARRAAASGEIESFDDPSSLQNVRLESGRVYTAEYLWADDARLIGAEGAQGGVSYVIPSTGGTGSWPMFSVTPRASASEIESKAEVSFWIYLKADESKLTEENKTTGIRIAIFPTPGSTGDVRVDKYAKPNEWTKITVTASAFVSCYNTVGVGKTGFFWVQNGAPADLVTEIRIAGILAEGEKIVRPEAAENEIENFADAGSTDSLSIANDAENIGWTKEGVPGGGSAAYADIKRPDESIAYEPYPAVTVTARRSLADYTAVAQNYNAVTMQVYLVPEKEEDAGSLARMNYWAQQEGMNDSQGTVAVGKWVTLTFSLDTYLSALGQSEDGSVKLFWVQSSYDLPITRIYVRNVQLSKTDNITDLASEGFLVFESDNLTVSYSYETNGVPAGQEAALKAAFTNSGDNWPNFKFSADKNLLTGKEALKVTLYIQSSADSVSAVMWPFGGKSADGVTLKTNEWITLEFETDALLEVYNWSLANGIAVTCPFWFTNTQAVNAVYIAGFTAGDLSEKEIAFADSGISAPSEVTLYESDGRWDAWIDLSSTKGFAYRLTLTHNGKTLEYGTDYTIGDKDGGLCIMGAEAGEYLLTFESYNNRFEKGSLTVTVREKDLSVSAQDIGNIAVGEIVTLSVPELTGANDQKNVAWTYSVTGPEEVALGADNSFVPSVAGTYTVTCTASYYGKTYTGEYTVTVVTPQISVAQAQEGTPGVSYTLPEAQLKKGDTLIEDAQWTYSVVGPEGEVTVQDGAFVPSVAGEYTLTYTATYAGKEYVATVKVTIADLIVSIAQAEDGQAGVLYTFPDAELKQGNAVIEGAEWSYSAVGPNGAESMTGNTFVPSCAGEYTLTFTATYAEIAYSGSVTISVARAAAQENEVELFADKVSLENVRLESGGDFAETYLEKGNSALPADAEGGVSFKVDYREGGSWPNLYFTSRMSGEQLGAYDSVVIRLYIGVEEGCNAERVMIQLYNGNQIFVAPETWVNIVISSQVWQERGMTAQANSILWVQNGDANTLFNQIDEIRVAGVYCVNEDSLFVLDMNTVGAFTGSSVWGDSGLAGDADSTDRYYSRSLAPAGAPEGFERVLRFANDAGVSYDGGMKWGNFYVRPSMTAEQIGQAIADGYKTMDVSLYIGASSETVNFKAYPDNGDVTKLPTNKWVTMSFDLAAFLSALQGNGQVKLFWIQIEESAPVQEVWLTNFTLGGKDKADILRFDSDAALSYFSTAGGTNVSGAEYVTDLASLGALPEGLSAAGAVKLTFNGDVGRIRLASGDKNLYGSYDTVRLLVYIQSDKESVQLGFYHENGPSADHTALTGQWVVIEMYARAESGNDGIWNVFNWYGDGTTGWLNFEAGVQCVYVAGIWLE